MIDRGKGKKIYPRVVINLNNINLISFLDDLIVRICPNSNKNIIILLETI